MTNETTAPPIGSPEHREIWQMRIREVGSDFNQGTISECRQDTRWNFNIIVDYEVSVLRYHNIRKI